LKGQEEREERMIYLEVNKKRRRRRKGGENEM
jgi:hypothetical protein